MMLLQCLPCTLPQLGESFLKRLELQTMLSGSYKTHYEASGGMYEFAQFRFSVRIKHNM